MLGSRVSLFNNHVSEQPGREGLPFCVFKCEAELFVGAECICNPSAILCIVL